MRGASDADAIGVTVHDFSQKKNLQGNVLVR